jgi:hypothetical protein
VATGSRETGFLNRHEPTIEFLFLFLARQPYLQFLALLVYHTYHRARVCTLSPSVVCRLEFTAYLLTLRENACKDRQGASDFRDFRLFVKSSPTCFMMIQPTDGNSCQSGYCPCEAATSKSIRQHNTEFKG